ncbi:ABC transporter permease [Actinosynnema sp. NPDC047251]|uniref:Transport permease protein n=1 Tax=Saccharothrix espanaensis (strain ATCC 51144 / DSM 44229 / JCM 9112 / NBRC 15066 / NRRL 15764) TaxID=1179773 RepID=K0JQG3_SACES|nr:ABC transporter permease [Saccharothrix espanaensis]CCH27881.1 ABC-type transporter [Saccharothrix espanaensis DSM 44229]
MSTLDTGLSRGRFELRQFFRDRGGVVFTFALPAFILLLLGNIFDGEVPGGEATMGQVYAAGLIGAGIISTSFITLGVGVAQDRENGTLKRLQGTPMAPFSYFVGKIALVLVLSLAEVVLMLAVGIWVFDVELPTEPGRWLTFAWVFLLGVVSCSLLGIAASALARTAASAPAVMNLPYIGLQFISGVFIQLSLLPKAMVVVSSFFPLKWVAQGFRSVLLPDSMAIQEAAGTWEHGKIALVLGAWCVIGFVLCLVGFRWTSERSGS